MNSNKTRIPLSGSAKVDLVRKSLAYVSNPIEKANFEGACDPYNAGLVAVLAEEVGRSLAALVQDEKEFSRRMTDIAGWGAASFSRAIIGLLGEFGAGGGGGPGAGQPQAYIDFQSLDDYFSHAI